MKPLPFAAPACLLLALVIGLFSCSKPLPIEKANTLSSTTQPTQVVSTTSTVWLTHPDHIIFVWFENKGYPQIIGNTNAPYINSLLKKGTLFTADYALTHPSYPNYIALFSGSRQGVTSDSCIGGTPFSAQNLYTVLKAAGKSFAWYSEGLPYTGSRVCKYGYYVERHNPTTIFSNVSSAVNKPFSDFPTDYTKLEKVVCISPNLMDNMHNGSITQGDTWLKNKLSNLVEWCRTHNSIFVVFWDEDNKYYGNRIPVVAVGQHVKPYYQLSTKYDHYSWTRTICAMFNASTTWCNTVSSRTTITGCWY